MDLSDDRREPFALRFEALADHWPLRWQRRLLHRLCSGNVPSLCDLPTGLGKTSVIPIWLIALTLQAQNGTTTLPRRLVYIVNRRTVVDQATNVVQQIRERLLQPENDKWSQHKPTLAEIASALRQLAGSSDLFLAVSTLRGELADNEEWKADPARPAIIIGTIDMIGSKLLFSGYGDGPYWRPQHAGLIGHDSLVVHDEAHLTPAFSELLRHVSDTQQECEEPRPIRLMELSATARNSTSSLDVFGLEPEDYEDETVRLRLNARKDLRLNLIDESELIENVVTTALSHEGESAKTLIYVRRPEDAQAVVKGLRKKAGQERVALLTGTIRGYERDRLAERDPAYRAFLNSDEVLHSVYLVSTSAGEVGIDLDADHMVCDATTLDAMIQRLGRVNRRGGVERRAKVDVLGPNSETKRSGSKDLLAPAIAATLSAVSRWQNESPDRIVDVSPEGLRKLLESLSPNEREKAFAPKPASVPLNEILLDAWSMTSIKGELPGRPQVAEYLHGLTSDPPETYVAWRKEITLLKDAEADQASVEDWFRACPILSHERLRDLTGRVRDSLAKILQQRRKNDSHRDFPVVLLDERGEAKWLMLSDVAERNSKIEYRTVVLPAEAGGLNEYGTLDSGAEDEARDVAEESRSIRRRRWISVSDETNQLSRALITGETVDSLPHELRERERVVLVEAPEGETENASRALVVWVGPNELAVENPETAKFRQALSIHSDFIAKHAHRIASALVLGGSLTEVLVLAARWHDRGKNRPVWQRFARNPSGREPLAKSTRYLHGRALGGYRHEFGSLLDAAEDPEIQAHQESDLILHLIAAHHGWARPHFELNAGDPKHTSLQNEEAAGEVMRRFGYLQQRFGRWGLAWLESLLRCADIAASKEREQVSKPERPEKAT